jgi:two-component system OmpR family sensor kinase
VSKGRLTRQELGWLLTQEASGAAERLRLGVQVLKSNAPPPMEPGSSPPVDATLDALDDAMRMLSSIHKAPSSVRGRRGRIDLAALVWEVAPEAPVSFEPGGGTEVYGDEGELRRMIHLLVGHGSGAGSAVTIRREADDVRVSVVLGPDSSATAETERAWLHRMAIRYGGRHELEGGMEVLSLPADGVTEAKERDLLRKELDEARKQGEAYARELAQVFAQGEEVTTPSTFPPPLTGTAPAEKIGTLARFAGGIAAELRGLLSQVGRDVQTVRAHTHSSGFGGHPPPSGRPSDEGDERLEAIKRRMRQVQEIVAELALVGELDANEGLAELDLVDLVRSGARNVVPALERGAVDLKVVIAPDEEGLRVPVRLAPRAGALLVRELLAQAVAATSRDQQVVVTVTAAGHGSLEEAEGTEAGPRLTVDDSGAALPANVRRAFMNLELEPSTYGRPSSIPLYVCSEVAAWQGILLELSDAPAGGLRVGLNFSRVP